MSTPPLQPLVMRRAPQFPDINRYKRDRVLGKGNFGKVCLAHSPSGNCYAIKEMVVRDKMRSQTDRAIWEVRLASQVGRGHPFIVAYKEATVHNGVVYIVMEYAGGGSLKSLIGQYSSSTGALPESLVRRYVLQLALALKTVHDGYIIHRDLKTENVFLDADGNAKLGDFGLARTMHHSQLAYTSAGTPGYIAPEILLGHPYDFKADVWSLGCIAYEMCTGKLPYHPSQRAAIVYQSYAPISTSLYSTDLADLIARMLDKSCHTRPSVVHLLDSAYLRAAFAADLTPDQRARFDSSGSLVHRSMAADTHADDIQGHLVGSIRAFDFADETYSVAKPLGARGSGVSTSEDSTVSELAESDEVGTGVHRISPPSAGAPATATATATATTTALASASASRSVSAASSREVTPVADSITLKMAALKRQFESLAGDEPAVPLVTVSAPSSSTASSTSSTPTDFLSSAPASMAPMAFSRGGTQLALPEYSYASESLWGGVGVSASGWGQPVSMIGPLSSFGTPMLPFGAPPVFRPFGMSDARSTAFYF